MPAASLLVYGVDREGNIISDSLSFLVHPVQRSQVRHANFLVHTVQRSQVRHANFLVHTVQRSQVRHANSDLTSCNIKL